jgi:sodium transport system ATP-binding protein
VSFSAPDGQITGILGPNGAGKTTTLRILYTLLKPDQGEAQVDGFDTCLQAADVQRRIGARPDSQGLYARLTARENIRYYGRMHGMSGISLEERIDELVRLLDMQEYEDRRTEGFSSGQRIKVAIARAGHDPTMILDEPTNGKM